MKKNRWFFSDVRKGTKGKARFVAALLAFVMAFCWMPASTGAAFASVRSGEKPSEAKASYAANEVIVLFQKGEVSTDTSVTPRASSAKTAQSFGKVMTKTAGTEGTKEAKATVADQADILKASLGDKYVISDTMVFQGAEEDGTQGRGESGDLVVSVIHSDAFTTEELVTKLSENDAVAAVSPNYKRHILDYDLNDPYISSTWWLNDADTANAGGSKTSAHGAAGDTSVNAASLWGDTDSLTDERVVAVIDTGVDYKHEELASKMWKNPAAKTGLNGTYGYDFSAYDADPMDEHGHGTHCSGIIAAQAGNGVGISGVAGKNSGIRIMALRFLDAMGSGFDDDALGAYCYISKALDAGVPVVAINNSWGGEGDSAVFSAVMDEVGKKGALSFCAAGNEMANNDEVDTAPANAESPYCITVAATNEQGGLASYSNYGRVNVDIASPGTNILSSVCYNNYMPWTYSADKLAATTGHYGEVTTETTVAEDQTTGTDVAVLAPGTDDPSAFGAAQMHALSGASGTMSLSLDTTSYLRASAASGSPASLKWTIRNVKEGEQYVLYFPYEKTDDEDGSQNFNIAMRLRQKGVYDGFWFTGDMVCAEKDGTWTISNDIEKMNDMYADESFADIWSASGTPSGLLSKGAATAKVNAGGSSAAYGLGIVFVAQADLDEVSCYVDSLGIAKPGVSEDTFGKYDLYSGTSMATPAAAGCAALLSAKMQTKLNAAELATYVKESVHMTDGLSKSCTSGGYIDLAKFRGDGQASPVLNDAVIDAMTGNVTLRGTNLGAEKGTVSWVDTNGDDTVHDVTDSVVWAADGKSVVIPNAADLSGRVLEFTLTSAAGKVTRYTTFLAKGLNRYSLYGTLGGGSEDEEEEDEEEFFSSESGEEPNQLFAVGDKLYQYDQGGDLYQVVKNSGELTTEDAAITPVGLMVQNSENYQKWNLSSWEEQNFKGPKNLGGMVCLKNKVYQWLEFDYSVETFYVLVSLDLSEADPEWVIESDSKVDKAIPANLRRVEPVLAGYKGELYLIGGQDPDTKKGTTDVYVRNAKTGAWTAAASLPEGVFGGYTAATGGKLYYVLGNTDQRTISRAVLEFSGSAWKALKELPEPLYVWEEEDEEFFFFFDKDADGDEEASDEDKELRRYVKAAVGADKNGLVISGITFPGVGDTLFYNTAKQTYWNGGYTLFTKINRSVTKGTVAGKYLYAAYGTEEGTEIRRMAVDTFAPGQAVISKVDNLEKGPKLIWKIVSDADKYIVYRKQGNGSWEAVKTLKAGSVTWTDPADGLVNGAKYQYRVDTQRTQDGETYTTTGKTKTSVWLAPVKIKKAKNLAKGIQIVWNKNAKASGYIVMRSVDGGLTFRRAKVLAGASKVKWTDTAAKKGGLRYTYKIVPYRTVSGTDYEGAPSNEQMLHRILQPAVPGITAGKGTLTVKAKKPVSKVGGVRYEISYKLSGGKWTSKTTDKQTLKISSLKAGKYTVRIRAYRKAGGVTYYGVWSKTKTVTVK